MRFGPHRPPPARYDVATMLTLTDEQQRDLRATLVSPDRPAEVLDPGDRRRYLRVPVEDLEALNDDVDRFRWSRAASRTLGHRLAEGA